MLRLLHKRTMAINLNRVARIISEEMARDVPPWTDPKESDIHNAAVFLSDKTSRPKVSHLMTLIKGDVHDLEGSNKIKAYEIIATLDEKQKLALANRLMAIGDEKLTLEMDPAASMWKGQVPNMSELTFAAKILANAAVDAIGVPMVADDKQGMRVAAVREAEEKMMKITREHLGQIIKEELSGLIAEGKKSKDKIPHGNETRDDAWSGGDNLVAPAE